MKKITKKRKVYIIAFFNSDDHKRGNAAVDKMIQVLDDYAQGTIIIEALDEAISEANLVLDHNLEVLNGPKGL